MGRRLIATAEAAGMIGASILVSVFVLLAMVSCSNDDAYDEMPSEVKSFVAHYFPNTAVESCTVDHNEIFVKLKDGPSISFDQNQKLKMVNGNGATLPQVLLFDTLPPKLYEYIENDNALNQAYILEFSTKTVYVVLRGQALIYDNVSGEIHSEIIN